MYAGLNNKDGTHTWHFTYIILYYINIYYSKIIIQNSEKLIKTC